YIIASLIIFSSCEETIILDTDQGGTKTMIEAVVTDLPNRQYVRLSTTVDFYSEQAYPAISDADVSVTDGFGTVHHYSESVEQPGYYYPDVDYTGEAYVEYSLNVNIDGDIYTASDVLLPVTPIDSLTVRLDEDEMDDPEEDGMFYTPLLYAKEPQDEENYYLWKFYRNGEIHNDDGDYVTLSNDVAIGENIDGVEAPLYFAEGDVARVEMISLTRGCFVFYSDLTNLVFSDGGVFTPQPANPRSNITGGALGVFQVSSIAVDEIVIE
ncbi:MAG: DUF4249 domain-containing protein, partial [Cyclobacteriaceae bacterium]